MIPTILAWAVIVICVPLNCYVTVKLWRLSISSPDLGVLRERTLVALLMAVVVTIFAAVFLNNGMETPILNVEQTQLLTRSAILALSIPPLYWVYLYRNGH